MNAGTEIILPSLIPTCIKIRLSFSYMHDGATLETSVTVTFFLSLNISC